MWQKMLCAVIDASLQAGVGLRNYYTEYQLDMLRHATSTPLSVLFILLSELERTSPQQSKSLVKQALTSAKLLEQTVLAVNDREQKQQQVNITKLLTTLCAWCSNGYCKVELSVVPSRRVVTVYNLNEARLQEALLCLIKNAVEASHDSSVVSVLLIDKDTEVVIVVKDFGKGMNGWQQFFSWLPYVTSKQINTGIGMFVAKQVIEELHGKVWLQTSQQFGTYIECSIPKHR